MVKSRTRSLLGKEERRRKRIARGEKDCKWEGEEGRGLKMERRKGGGRLGGTF